MSSLHECQADFAAALLEPVRAVPARLVVPRNALTVRRFAVYRNNVTAGLIEVLRESYPAVARLVGDDFFHALAVEFLRARPPRSPLMFAYGDQFAEFVECHPACESLPYLGDVARIERAWLEAYHAAEAEPLAAAELIGRDAQEIAATPIGLHPTLRIVASPWPALSIWHANVVQAEVEPIDLDAGGEIALALRPLAQVTVRPISAGTQALIAAIAGGADLISAARNCAEVETDVDLAHVIEILIEAGAFVVRREQAFDATGRMRT